MVLVEYKLISVGRHSQQVVRTGLLSRLVFGFLINNTDEKMDKGEILHNGLADKVSEMFRSGLIRQSEPIKVHVILILPSQSQYTKLYVGTKKGQSSRAKPADGLILANKEKRLTGQTLVSVYRDIVLDPESIVQFEPSSMSLLHIFTESVGVKIYFTVAPYYKSLTHYLKLYCVGFVIKGYMLDLQECQGKFVNISR